MPNLPFLLTLRSGFTPADIGLSGLAAPASLSLVSATSTTLAVGWAAVASATEYIITCSDPGGNLVQSIRTTGLECIFDNLVTVTAYTIVAAASASGSSTITNTFSTT